MLPRERVHPFDLPPEYERLRAEAPISRFRWPNGVEGWLVTRYDHIRTLLADNRLSIDRGGKMPPSLAIGRKPVMMPRSLVSMDPPEHTKWRRLILRDLTPGKARALEPRIEAITREYLARMREQGPPVDLLSELAFPVPSRIICELLGVPASDQEFFQRQTHVRSSVASTPDQVDEATIALTEYLTNVVDETRRKPVDDLLSHLGLPGRHGDAVAAGRPRDHGQHDRHRRCAPDGFPADPATGFRGRRGETGRGDPADALDHPIWAGASGNGRYRDRRRADL
jgi:cytochrome P450